MTFHALDIGGLTGDRRSRHEDPVISGISLSRRDALVTSMTILDRFRLDGDAVLVTGAASGIGRAYAEATAGAGADVALIDIDEDGLEEATDEVAEMGDGDATAIVADVSEEDDVDRMVDETVDAYGGLDVAFANAGVGDIGGSIWNYDVEQWDDLMDVNLRGTFMTNKAAATAMRGNEDGGAIVNTASVLSFVGNQLPGLSAYVASKGGVLQLTKQLATELGGEGIRVNAIAPGFVHTNIGQGAFKEDSPIMQTVGDELEDATALGRLGYPDDMKGAAVYLASDASAYCTGAAYLVDGGWTASVP